MREIVRDPIWVKLATDRGDEAVHDPELFDRVAATIWGRFDAFCSSSPIVRRKFSAAMRQDFATTTGFDVTVYVQHNVARRHALNVFIREKPHVIVIDGRFFTVTFLSVLEMRIDELTPNEVAAVLNGFLKPRSLFATVVMWWRRTVSRFG
jgi:hypothetical protein